MAETVVAGWSPFETDLGAAKCLILWGMNPAASSLPSMRGYTDLQKAGMKIIVVDPRFSETASKADLWLPLRPGSDTALWPCCAPSSTRAFTTSTSSTTGATVSRSCVSTWLTTRRNGPPPITWLTRTRFARRLACTPAPSPAASSGAALGDQFGTASTTTALTLALSFRAICGNLEVPGGDGMPGPALNFITDEEIELNELLPEEQKAKQIGSNKFKLTSWPGYTLISDNAKRTWGKTLPAEWFCEAHGPSVFKAILTGEPYQIAWSYRERDQPGELLRRCQDDARRPEEGGVPGHRRLLDDAHGAALRLRVPGRRRSSVRPSSRTTARRTRSSAAAAPSSRFSTAIPTCPSGASSAWPAVRIPRTGRGRRKRKSTTTSSSRWVSPPTGTISWTTSACTIRRCTRTSTSPTVVLDPLGQGGVRLFHPARAGLSWHAHLSALR